MESSFVLGFIAGEGTFSTEATESDSYRYNLRLTPKFQVKVKEVDVVREMRDHVGVGRVNVYGDYGVWRVSDNDGYQKLIEWVDEHAESGFKSTHKWDSYTKWREFVQEREDKMKTRDGIKDMIELSREINSESARTNAKSVSELKEIVDQADVFVCGAPTRSGGSCEQVVPNRGENCYRHV